MGNIRLTGRTGAMLGVGTAAAATLMIVAAGPALAADSQLTSCTDQVRVRSEPNEKAPVIGSCKPGEKVTVDRTENGWAHLENKQGWASDKYVAVKNKDDNSRDSDSRDRFDNSDYRDDDNYRDGDNYRDEDYRDDDRGSGLLGGL